MHEHTKLIYGDRIQDNGCWSGVGSPDMKELYEMIEMFYIFIGKWFQGVNMYQKSSNYALKVYASHYLSILSQLRF